MSDLVRLRCGGRSSRATVRPQPLLGGFSRAVLFYERPAASLGGKGTPVWVSQFREGSGGLQERPVLMRSTCKHGEFASVLEEVSRKMSADRAPGGLGGEQPCRAAATHLGPRDSVPFLAGKVGRVQTGVLFSVWSYAKGLTTVAASCLAAPRGWRERRQSPGLEVGPGRQLSRF